MADLSGVSDADLMSALGRPQQNIGQLVSDEATRQGVDPHLALSVWQAEGAGGSTARSRKGAIGPMQLMPSTAMDMGVDPTDLHGNIRGGVGYLKKQLDTFRDPHLAVAAYNAGPGAVRRAGGVPNYPETRAYVDRVIGSRNAAAMSDHELMAALGHTGSAPDATRPGAGEETPPWMDYAPQTAAADESPPWLDYADHQAGGPQAQTGADIFDGVSPGGAQTSGPAPSTGADIFADGPSAQLKPAAPEPPPFVVNPETKQPYNPAQQAAYRALFASGKLDPNASAGSQTFPRGLTDEKDTPNPGDWYVDLQGQLKQAPGANYGRDAVDGFWQPFDHLGHDVMEGARNPGALSTTPRLAMDALSAIPSAVLGAATRPAADFLRQVLPTPYAAPRLTMQNGKVVVDGPRPLHGTEALDATQGILDTSIGGLRAAAPTRAASALEGLEGLKPADLPAESKKAWDAVDASTYRVPKSDLLSASDDIAAALAEHGGSALYPKAAQIAERVRSLAGADEDMTVGKLNRLKSQAGMKLLGPGSDEVDLGKVIKDRIEKVILESNDPSIGPARDLYTRLKKVEAVNKAVESADLSAQGKASAPAKLRPYLDPKSTQQIRNLTPEERAAMKSIVKDGSQMNPLRMLSNFRLSGPIAGPILAGLAAPTHGLSAAVGVAGNVAKAANEATTAGKIQNLLELMAAGGKSRPIPPINPTLALAGRPAASLASPRGLIGATATLQLLNQRPAAAR